MVDDLKYDFPIAVPINKNEINTKYRKYILILALFEQKFTSKQRTGELYFDFIFIS